MIKPANISKLNTSKVLKYECEKCGERGEFYLENRIINIDDDGNPIESLKDYECPKCQSKLVNN